jgi:hypothetical protein
MVAPPGKADSIACEEQSALTSEPSELVVALLLEVSLALRGVSLELGEEVMQAEKARTSPRTATTLKLRRMRLLRALEIRRDRAVVDDKGVLPRCARVDRQFTLRSTLKRKKHRPLACLGCAMGCFDGSLSRLSESNR